MWVLNGIEVLEGITTPSTLPWHVQYQSFAGTLPRISSVRITIVGFAFLINVSGVNCLYQSTQVNPQVGRFNANETTGQLESFTLEPVPNVKLHAGNFLCPTEIGLAGTGGVTVAGSTTKLTVRLVQ